MTNKHIPAPEYTTQQLPAPLYALYRTLAAIEKYEARINGEQVPVHEIVDVDPADNRVYVKTHAESITFVLPTEQVQPVTA